VCAGAGRLRCADLDALAFDAAAAQPFVALVVATFIPVAVLVRWQPELGAGFKWRATVQPGLERRRPVIEQWGWRRPVVFQPQLQQRPVFEPGRRS
jgi:hypothetical protein